jgi:predicted RNase H-like HicB family nuclease
MLTNAKRYNFWFLFQRDERIRQWVAHCLDLDVISQGKSLESALAMVSEACHMVITDDLAASRDPLSRRAPEEFWAQLYKLVNGGVHAEFDKVNEEQVKTLACQVIITVRQSPKTRPVRRAKVPLSWAGPSQLAAGGH